MTCTTVHNQQELDAALTTDGVTCVHIESDAGVWLEVPATDRKLYIRGSSRAVLWGSSRAVLWGSSRAVLWGSSSAELWDSSSAELRGSSSAELWGSSSAELRDSSSAELWGSSSAELWDSSSAELRDSSSAEAAAATSVHARDRATVQAGPHVAVHLHSGQATVDGGVIIDLTALDLHDPATWCEHHGVSVADGSATLYKAVAADLCAGHQHTVTRYEPGTEVTAPDWHDDRGCGGGLHLSPSPNQAAGYRSGGPNPTRYLQVTVPVTEIRPIGDDKAKARTVRVVREVDRWREPVTSEQAEVSA